MPAPTVTVLADGTPLEFTYTETAPFGRAVHICTATVDGRVVGIIRWDAHNGEISRINVAGPWRRQGVGTALWNAARTPERTPACHSPHRTALGDAWARSVGGHLPELARGRLVGDRTGRSLVAGTSGARPVTSRA